MDVSVPVTGRPADDPVSLVLARLLAEGQWLDPKTRGALAAMEASARAGLGLLRLWVDVDARQEHAPEALELVLGAVQASGFSRRQVRRARRTLINESEQGWLIASEVHRAALRQVAYGSTHPLTTPADRAGLRQVRPSQVETRLQALIAEGRPSLAVVGPSGLVAAAVAASLTPWSGQGVAATLPGPTWTDGLTLVDQPGETQVQVSLMAPAPGAFDPSLPATEVLARVLGGTLTGRLDRALRVERGWVYAVDSSVQAWPGHGVLLIQCTVDPLLLADALMLIEDELRRLYLEPPDNREVAIARRALMLDEVETQVSAIRLADALGAQAAYGGAPDSRSQRVAALRAVDGAAVLDAARATGLGQDGGHPRWVITGDATLVEEALDAAGRTPDRIWSGRTLLPPT
jgi:predicted Zn-dependent peptidase